MKITIRNIFKIFFLFSLLTSLNSHATLPTDSSLAPMLQKVLPAVVNIRAQVKVMDFNTNRLQRDGGQNSQQNTPGENKPDKFVSVASGVIVEAEKGYILTNAHVVEDAQNIVVNLDDGRHFNAKVIGTDKASDV